MAINVALIPPLASEIPPLSLYVDGYPDESHNLSTNIGKSPLESGAEATDHAVAKPEVVELTGWVSGIHTIINVDGVTDNTRPRLITDAWAAIRELQKSLEPVTVITGLGIYQNMLVREVKGSRIGQGLRFVITMEEVIRVGEDEGIGNNAGGPATNRTDEVLRGYLDSPELDAQFGAGSGEDDDERELDRLIELLDKEEAEFEAGQFEEGQTTPPERERGSVLGRFFRRAQDLLWGRTKTLNGQKIVL